MWRFLSFFVANYEFAQFGFGIFLVFGVWAVFRCASFGFSWQWGCDVRFAAESVGCCQRFRFREVGKDDGR